MRGVPLSRAPNIFQLSMYLKSNIYMAKNIFDPINKDHPMNFEIQSDTQNLEISIIR